MAEHELKDRKKEIERREKRCKDCKFNEDWNCTYKNWPCRLMIICHDKVPKDGEQ